MIHDNMVIDDPLLLPSLFPPSLSLSLSLSLSFSLYPTLSDSMVSLSLDVVLVANRDIVLDLDT